MTLTIRPASPGIIDNAPTKRFMCHWPGCSHAYVRRTILRNHIEAVHKRITHICFECGQEFRYKNDLKQHQKRLHDKIRPFVCKVEYRNHSNCACGRRYVTRSELNRHQRTNPDKNNADDCRDVATTASTGIFWRSPAQLGSLRDLESAIIGIRSYVSGSIGCGNWIVKKTQCQSVRMNLLESPANFSYLNQLKTISAALRARDFQQARIQLNRHCQTTQQGILGEGPELFSKMILFGVKMHASDSAQGTCFRTAYDWLTEYYFSMSMTAHGASHPWTMVMKIMWEQRCGTNPHETMLTMLRALQDSYEYQLGADNLINLMLRIHVTRQMDNATTRIRYLLDSIDSQYGRDSLMSLKCAKELLDAMYDRGDYDAVKTELASLEARLNDFVDHATHVTWEYEIWKWRHILCSTLQDWHRDVAIVSEQIIPRGEALFGENDERLSTWLLELERALEGSQQWGCLKETRAYRLSILERLEAEYAKEDSRQ